MKETTKTHLLTPETFLSNNALQGLEKIVTFLFLFVSVDFTLQPEMHCFNVKDES